MAEINTEIFNNWWRCGWISCSVCIIKKGYEVLLLEKSEKLKTRQEVIISNQQFVKYLGSGMFWIISSRVEQKKELVLCGSMKMPTS